MPFDVGAASRRLLVLTCVLLSGLGAAADPAKTLRLAIEDIDTLDPQQWQDRYSREIGSAIFEALYEWDYLARPPGIVANTAAGPPEVSADGTTWTVRLKHGIRFTPDPAFGGKLRELTAGDYVYAAKRALDPNLRSGGDPIPTELIVGMRAVVDAARRPGGRLDYDAPVEGLRAVDRYTLQYRIKEPNFPIMTDQLVGVRAVAREVVEAAGGDIQARAVGTGPYQLKEWKRGSRVVLEANPAFRTLEFPRSADPAHADLVRSMRGKALPQVGTIVFSVISEMQTRVLEFQRGMLDYVELKGDGAQQLLRNGALDPALARRGVRRVAYPLNSVRSAYFYMNDPVVGGMGKEHVALRRAMALGFDAASLIDVVYAGQALPATQILPPGVSGFDAARSDKLRYDPRTANLLLDRFGYGKRDPEGFRQMPDGKPLNITFTLFTGTVWREMQTLWKKNMDAIGVRMVFRSVPTQDLFKEAAQGKFQMNVHGRTSSPIGLTLATLYSKELPESNDSRFDDEAYDRAFEAFMRAPDEAGRLAAARIMNRVVDVYVPIIPMAVDVENSFAQPWVSGYFPSPFATYYKYVDIDLARQRQGVPR